MSFLDRFRKKTEDEASRIARLSKTGRMTDGNIIDAVSDDTGRITQVTYTYQLAGVLYESSQALNSSNSSVQTITHPASRSSSATIHVNPRTQLSFRALFFVLGTLCFECLDSDFRRVILSTKF